MDVPEIIFSSEKKKTLKTGSMEYFSANDFSLTEKELEKARKELFETEEKKITKIEELRNKLSNDKDIHCRIDTPSLLRFLRVRKFDCDKAYQNIREGFLFKRRHPETLKIPENLENLLNLNMVTYLPYTNENGNILFYIDSDKWKCEETSVEEVMQVTFAVANITTMNPRIQVNGAIGIWDWKMLSLKHVTLILRNYSMKECTYVFQNSFPWRIKQVLIINSSLIARLVFKMFRPFLKKKIYERFFLLGSDMNELHQYVNPVLLPKKLGGFLDENQYNVTENIMNNISYLKYEVSFT